MVQAWLRLKSRKIKHLRVNLWTRQSGLFTSWISTARNTFMNYKIFHIIKKKSCIFWPEKNMLFLAEACHLSVICMGRKGMHIFTAKC